MDNSFSFTKARIESLDAPKEGRAHYRDTGVDGLSLAVHAKGHRYFYWYRKVRNRPTWRSIGLFPDLSVEDARTRAAEFNTASARWKADKYKGPNPFERRDTPTLDALVDEYVEKHLRGAAKNPVKAEASVRRNVKKYLSAWRERKIDEITSDDVRALFRKIGAKHQITANGVKELVSRLYHFAAREKLWSGENPTVGIKGYPRVQRERFLQPDELPRLWAALRESNNLDLIDFVNLGLWTRARKADILGARWVDVHLDDNRWTIPNPKSRKAYVVALTPESVEIFRSRVRNRVDGNEWVFPSRAKTKTGHLMDLKRSWKRLLQDAGLYHADRAIRPCQHDLRRTGASYAAAQGDSLLMIGESLGHAPGSSATAIYSRLNVDRVRQSMLATNAAMAALMRKKPPKLLPAPKPAKAARRG